MEMQEDKILAYYKSKRSEVLKELDTLNSLIRGIETRLNISNTNSSSKPSILGAAVSAAIKPTKLFGGGAFFFDTIYSEAMTYQQKIHFALEKLGTATVYEMVELIGQYEALDDHEREKLFNGLTLTASTLNTKGELNAEKEGRRNRYSINLE